MKPAYLAIVLLVALQAPGQVATIHIPAGSPEDKAIQAANAENDAQKRLALWQQFVQTFSSNPQAVAYGNWQIAQQYLDQGDTAKALEYGDKARTAQPGNLDILVSVAAAAQKLNNNSKLIECAVEGGNAFNGIARQPQPQGMEADAFALKIQQDQAPYRQSYEYLEAAALNAITAEQDPKQRMAYIEQFMAAFPNSRLQEEIMQTAVYTLGQLKDAAGLSSFADKALAADPNGVGTLVVLAVAFAEFPDPAYLAKAETYAHKALDLTSGQTKMDEAQLHLYSGSAHSALGYALLRQEKNPPAIVELKAAVVDLKGHADLYAAALYRLGFAYAKTGKLPEAKTALTEAAAIKGPYQQMAQDLLAKVAAAGTKGRTR
jgi:tetratricopeptide (TPR) repeat protein